MEAPIKGGGGDGVREIKLSGTGNVYLTSEATSEDDLRRECPVFFATPHGKRETIEAHRGQLIVRGTVKFGDDPPHRRTSIFLSLFGDGGWWIHFALSGRYTAAGARALVDRMLEEGSDLKNQP